MLSCRLGLANHVLNLTTRIVEDLAPDQASLKAASKLVKPGKWPVRGRADAANVIWGECQGSGSNPYRVIADAVDHGYKCSCPSRKFPCKHVLALMWQFAEDEPAFVATEPPDWVGDWLGRRKRAPAEADPKAKPESADNKLKRTSKAIELAALEAGTKPPTATPVAAAKREAARNKRAQQTRQSIAEGLAELQQWLDDQVRTGLAGLLNELIPRCRRIAARLVDAKAQGLASRLDELPARVLALRAEAQADGLMVEIGQLHWLIRAWLNNPDDPDCAMAVATGPTREAVLTSANALHIDSVWQVVGERVHSRRDGLISHSTWLLDTQQPTPRFAQLLDFFPASTGRRAAVFEVGAQFAAELAFYPSRVPERALIVQREATNAACSASWPKVDETQQRDPLRSWAARLQLQPWALQAPILFGAGRVTAAHDGQPWWHSATDATVALPLQNHPLPTALFGLPLRHAVAVWTGAQADLLCCETPLGIEAING